jgi:hypothetical protein
MLDEYRATVAEVLKSVNESDDEDDDDQAAVVQAAVVQAVTEVAEHILEERYGTEDETPTDSSSDQDKQKKNRFRWKYQLEVQKENGLTKELKTIHPFLSNTNDQDLMLSEKLIAYAPYRAGYGDVTKEWKSFRDIVAKAEDSNGKTPLAIVTDSSLKSRYNQYIALSQKVLDKTGLVLPDYSPVNEIELDQPYNTMPVALKIAHNFLSLLNNVRAMENEDRKREAEKEASKQKEDQDVDTIRTAALGKVVASSSFDSDVDIGSNKKARRSSIGSINTGTPAVQKKAAVGDFQLDSLVKNFELAQSHRNNMIDLMNQKKFDDLQERTKMEKEKFEFEKQRWSSEEENRKMMMQFQMNQAAMDAQHRKNVLDMEMTRIIMQDEMEKNRIRAELQREEQTAMMMKVLANLVGQNEKK